MNKNKELLYTEDNDLTVNGFIKKLQSLAPIYRNLPIKIEAKNGIMFTPHIMFMVPAENIYIGDTHVTAILISYK